MEQLFKDTFEHIYVQHHQGMVRFAEEFIGNKEDAQNIVQDAFAEVWESRNNHFSRTNYLLAFLFTTIRNRCIDYLRHQIVLRRVENEIQQEIRMNLQMKFDSLELFDPITFASEERIETLIDKAIQSLPQRCREIFIKSKLEGMKQQQIAEEFNISINTVETQMRIAYKKLKQELKDYFLLLFLFYL